MAKIKTHKRGKKGKSKVSVRAHKRITKKTTNILSFYDPNHLTNNRRSASAKLKKLKSKC